VDGIEPIKENFIAMDVPLLFSAECAWVEGGTEGERGEEG